MINSVAQDCSVATCFFSVIDWNVCDMTEKNCHFHQNVWKYRLKITLWVLIQLWDKWPKCFSDQNISAKNDWYVLVKINRLQLTSIVVFLSSTEHDKGSVKPVKMKYCWIFHYPFPFNPCLATSFYYDNRSHRYNCTLFIFVENV